MFRNNVKVMMFNNGKDKEKEVNFVNLSKKGLNNFWIYADNKTTVKVDKVISSKPSEKGMRLTVEKEGKKYIVESTSDYLVLCSDGEFKPLSEIKKEDSVKFFNLSGTSDVKVVSVGKKEFKGDTDMYDVDSEFRIVNHLFYKKA